MTSRVLAVYDPVMVQARSPGAIVLYAAYVSAALVAMVLWAAVHMPAVGMHFVATGDQVTAIARGRVIARLDPDEPVVFANPAGRLEQRAGELVPDFAPAGRGAEVSRWYAQRDELTRIARSGPVTVQLATGVQYRQLEVKGSPRRLSDLSVDVWLLLGQAIVIGLLGVWLVVLRPGDWGARMFLVSCLGVSLAAFSGAVFDAREVTADGRLLRLMQGLNYIGSNVCGTGLLAVFLCQPKPLFRPSVAVGIVVIGAAFGAAIGIGFLPLKAFYVGLLVSTGGYFALLPIQWLRARGDPAARSSLAWVGVTTLLGTAVLTLGMAAPQLLGLPSLGGDGMSFLPLFIVYGGIAFGVGGARLFDLDRWTYRLLLGAGATLGLVALDAALVSGIGLGGKLALAVSLLVVGYAYLPLRALLWRWVFGKPTMTSGEMVQAATEVAFSPSPAERPVRWRALLVRLYDPLDIHPADGAVSDAVVRDGGIELALPEAAGEGPLVLRHRARGRRLFGSAELALAGELISLLRNAEKTRDAYERGVQDERGRIARDLHDDVAARLLTSLHRQEVSDVRSDVRKAMSEIRTIVSSLTGKQVALEQALADMRHETSERLETAGIAFRWSAPLDGLDADLSYRTWRNLSSAYREVVTNILKHSNAKSVIVEVATAAREITVMVQDDGRGLGDATPAGNGLGNMRLRLEEVGGRIAFPETGRGMRVELTAPIS